jgi:glycosyltransferase involved in cell wall biosynthesis
MKPVLSVLICTVPSRVNDYLPSIITSLNKQCQRQECELIYVGDNKRMTVGEKRNWLLDMASGDYVVFIDDDDRVSDSYVETILTAIQQYPETACFGVGGHKTQEGAMECLFNFDPSHGKSFKGLNASGKRAMNWLPNHICVWKYAYATRVKFPNKSLGEDHYWADEQYRLGYTYMQLKDDLYTYNAGSWTETRMR